MTESWDKMKVSRIINKILAAYMMLPVLIFIIGWIKPIIAIPAAAAIVTMAYRLFRDESALEETLNVSKRDVETLVLAFLIIVVWTYFSGIGKLVFQNWDHIFRNSIFAMLVNNKWPVIKTFQFGGIDTPFLFVYYIGFWMPSALIGKLFGIGAGYIFQVIWACIGLWLFYWLICCWLRKITLFPLLIFMVFSGLDALGTALLTGADVSLFSAAHLEWWAGMSFSSFTTQLFWVFNQAIPAWILTLWILLQHKNKYIAFFLGISLICCPLPFIGILPFVAYVTVRNIRNCLKSQMTRKAIAVDLFSLENIFGGGISGLLTYLYFKANASGQHMVFLPASNSQNSGFLFSVILFLLLEVGIYAVIIYKYQKKNPLFYIAVLFLCTCPLFQIGYSGDYCMRACIPAQVVLFLLVVETIYSAKLVRDRVTIIALSFVICIGAITPLHELNRTIQKTMESYHAGLPAYTDTLTEEELLMGNLGSNFRGEALKSLFYKYLIK